MPRNKLPISCLSRYLLNGQVKSRRCVRLEPSRWRPAAVSGNTHVACSTLSRSPSPRAIHTQAAAETQSIPLPTPLRKILKDEAKAKKKSGKPAKSKKDNQTVDGWELTVGIEIHAQLNTAAKLFSPAATSFNHDPNTHVALFDAAIPGSQPTFQTDTVIPAVRAALAMNCAVQPISRFDRKHYFWWDQPSGYQITQYYHPFAKDGSVVLRSRDGIAAEDGEEVRIRIKQVQMEQDTAKTLAQPAGVHWLDYNRVGAPLVEIITEPDIHHPKTAAIFVKKVQSLLRSVDACVSGMEEGGLRADINVSVRRIDDPNTPLGTRTEIKNLSTIKAVEDAIIAERDRQIKELDSGRVIASETRGWALGSSETRRLRGKEGEVDYRYMPDPDLPPLLIGQDLVEHLRDTLAVSPDRETDDLVTTYGLTIKDATSLLGLNDGGRVEYFYRVVDTLSNLLQAEAEAAPPDVFHEYSLLAGNWILHELGKLSSDRASDAPEALVISPEGECEKIPSKYLAEILLHLYRSRITLKVAKQLLFSLYGGQLPSSQSVTEAIDAHDLWFHELSTQEYETLADTVLDGEPETLQLFSSEGDGPKGKVMFLLGKMMREAAERIIPSNAEGALRRRIAERRKQS